MKKAVFVLAALAAMLFTSCSGLFDNDTVKKSDGISCTIDASSFAQLPGARAASSNFTIALTMNNSSTGAAIQSASATCAPGGSCTLSFDPVATGTKVVFTGTIAYNGTAIATVSSEEYTIIEGANTVPLTITPSYSVSVSVDLSSYKVSDSGTITLTLKNNSDSTTQSKTVTGALSTAQTVTFDTAIATGTSVTASGYVLYSSKEAYYFTDKTFTVSSTTGTVSLSGYETEWFKYIGNSSKDNCYTGKVYYGLTASSGNTLFEDTVTADHFATAFTPAGQIYVVYSTFSNDSAYTYTLYTKGTKYTLSGITTPETYTYLFNTSLSYIPDSSGRLLLCLGWGDGSTKGQTNYYILTPSSDSYSVSKLTIRSLISADRITYATVSSVAVTMLDNTPYAFIGFRAMNIDENDAKKDYNNLYMCVAQLNFATSYITYMKDAQFSIATLSATNQNMFRRGTSFTDMVIDNGVLYLLLNDAPKNFSACATYGLNSRGALLSVNIADAVASVENGTIPAFTARGWYTGKQTMIDNVNDNNSYYTNSFDFFGTTTNDYSENCFAGARMFVALRPDKITMADYGVYCSEVGTLNTSCGKLKEKNATAVFDISNAQLSFTPIAGSTPDYTYGYYGSMIDGLSVDYIITTF